jgi:hypothetical protein
MRSNKLVRLTKILNKMINIASQGAMLYQRFFSVSKNTAAVDMIKVKVKVKVTLRLDGQSVSQSVSLGVEPHLGLMTRYLLLFHS